MEAKNQEIESLGVRKLMTVNPQAVVAIEQSKQNALKDSQGNKSEIVPVSPLKMKSALLAGGSSKVQSKNTHMKDVEQDFLYHLGLTKDDAP